MVSIRNHSKGEDETLDFKLATVEQDQGAVPYSTEHFGASGRKNCQRCLNSSVPNAGGRGFYQTGYISGEAYNGERKTDKQARKWSIGVKWGTKSKKDTFKSNFRGFRETFQNLPYFCLVLSV